MDRETQYVKLVSHWDRQLFTLPQEQEQEIKPIIKFQYPKSEKF